MKTGDNDNETEIDDSDTESRNSADNDDNDSTDMENDNDDEADDMDSGTTTPKKAAQSAQKASALMQLPKSASRLAAALDAQQTIKSIAGPPTVDSIIA